MNRWMATGFSVPLAEAPTDSELRAFVGRNAEYYLEKWALDDLGTLNLGALLLGGLWFGYRKLYALATVLWGCAILMVVVGYIALRLRAPFFPSPRMSVYMLLTVTAGLGITANGFYLAKAKKVIAAARARGLREEDHLATIACRGGTSLTAVLAFPLVALLAIFVCIFGLERLGLMPSAYGEHLSFNGTRVYYQPPVTTHQARRVGDYLVRNFPLAGRRTSVQLCQTGAVPQLRFVVTAATPRDLHIVASFRAIGQVVSEDVFAGAPMEVHLCDEHFKTVLTIRTYGKHLTFNSGSLYYTPFVTESEARRVGEYLVKTALFDGTPKTFQVGRSGETWELRMVLREGDQADERTIMLFKRIARELSSDVLAGAPLEIHLCDQYLAALKTVTAD